VSDLTAVRLRANPAWELVALADLGPEHAVLAAGLAEDPATYGVLLPRGVAGVPAKAVDRRAAALLDSLTTPSLVPATGEVDALHRELAGLVLDGALELEAPEGFVSGPPAHAWVLGGAPVAPAPEGRLSALSRHAVQRAAELPTEDTGELSGWLYRFNTIPLGPRPRRRLHGPDAVRHALGLGPRGPAAMALAGRYEAVEDPGWLVWRLAGPADPAELVYKLYVSPHPRELPDVFPPLVRVLDAHDVAAFKLGRDAHGLLRPDKLVAYFTGAEHLERVAAALAAELDGVTAQGVPFSGALTPDGLLSWGHDPPDSERLLPWQLRESWRLWVTNRLARALLDARRAPAGTLGAADYALDRLWLDGVDVAGWVPAGDLWAP
jgi:hypothetical protein